MKIDKKKTIFVYGFTCDIKETENANVLVTTINYHAIFGRRLTFRETIFKSEPQTGRTGASLTTRWIKFAEVVRTSAERAIASLPKMNFTTPTTV